MSLIKKIKNYNDLKDLSNRQQARILELEAEVINLKNKMERMSNTPLLRDKLDSLAVKYQKLRDELALDNA